MFAKNISEDWPDVETRKVAIGAFRRAYTDLFKYRDLSIDAWPHPRLSMTLSTILELSDRVITFMPSGRVNIDTPHAGGGAGLIDELEFEVERMVATVRKLKPGRTLMGTLSYWWYMFRMQQEINKIGRELDEGPEIPSLRRIRPKLIRRAIRDVDERLS
jgi:hypothetical protein